MEVPPQSNPDSKSTFTVLVTGANSGLGLSICRRLIDEFLLTRPQSQTLQLLFSTRDRKKRDATIQTLQSHLTNTLRSHDKRTPGVSHLLESRVHIDGVLVDLTRLQTVKALAEDLVSRGERIDAVVWNAGLAGWTGIDYLRATKDVLTGLIEATTYPKFMIGELGVVLPEQSTAEGRSKQIRDADRDGNEEPELGKVFTANVFGHYLLTHWLSPIFAPESRIVWVGSISGAADIFAVEDLQGLKTRVAYESSKRLTDYLVLTSDLPSTRKYVDAFLPPSRASEQEAASGAPQGRPQMYITHPGVIATTIVDLNIIIHYAMLLVDYISRWIGSPWHLIDPYKGAVSATYCVLAPPDQLPEREEREGKGKWGSACDVFGNEWVARTEVEGWGFGGTPGARPEGSVPNRRRGAPSSTREAREEFETVGASVWKEMEGLREEWESRLGDE